MRAVFRSAFLRTLLGGAALVLGPAGPAAGQDVLLKDRAPRFLAATSTPDRPVEVDVSSVPVLTRRVALRLEARTVGRALQAITRQTGIKFAYSVDVLPLDRPVALRAENITVAAALLEILIDTGVDVMLSAGNRLALVKRTTGVARAQAGVVVGRVTDGKTGDGLGGAEVFLEGTRWRTSTGPDGRYRLAEVAPGSYTLTMRRVGYGKQSRAVAVVAEQEVTIDIALQPVATQLNEIVTTVTGEQRRVELGHVVGRINADSLVREAPVSNLSELLTARVPGLQVAQTQGTIGGRVVVRVRGPNSLNLSNQPIVVIDGVRYTNDERATMFANAGPGDVEPSSPLNDVNINDIESIEVVKGPSAATLYGTDAANGVIVITTKRGRTGPGRWSAYAKGTITGVAKRDFRDIYWGWGTVNGVPNNSRVSCTLARLASTQCTRQDSITVLSNPLNDPRYTILAAKPSWEYGVNVAGGRQELRYRFSADFHEATGPIQMPPAIAEQLRQRHGTELPEEWREPNRLAKLNLRGTVTAGLGERADLHVSTGYVNTDTRALPRSLNPYVVSYSLSNPESPYGVNNARNPAQAYAQTTSEQVDRFVGSVNSQWQPMPWLATRATLGLDLASIARYGLVRPGDQPNFIYANGSVEDTRARQVATSAELGATATVRRGRVSARTAVGAQYVRTLYSGSGSFGSGLPPGASVPQRALAIETRQQYRETVVLGGYLEEMLGLNDRLFLTGALRLDGASTFGRGYDAAVYPKAGASWLVSEEPFLPRLPGLEELRLRYAFGASGKQPDPAWARPEFAATQMWLNGQVVNLVDVRSPGNLDLGPERVREHEFGFDATALGNRLALDVTWFRRRTTGMIVLEDGAVGRGSVWTNFGLVRQRGFEAQLRARVVDTRFLSWDLALQHADYTTTLDSLGSGSMLRTDVGGYVEGYPLGARFQWPLLSWQDVNGDGIVARDEVQIGDTAVYVGQSVPPRSQALMTVVGLFERRLRLSALLERKTGFTQINAVQCAGTCRAAVDRSTPFEDQAKALSIPGSTPTVEKGDYVRLREVSLGLALPVALTRALRLGSATLTVAARNLALWTDFSGPDPEVGTVDPFAAPAFLGGGSAGGVPMGRVFSARLDLGL